MRFTWILGHDKKLIRLGDLDLLSKLKTLLQFSRSLSDIIHQKVFVCILCQKSND